MPLCGALYGVSVGLLGDVPREAMARRRGRGSAGGPREAGPACGLARRPHESGVSRQNEMAVSKGVIRAPAQASAVEKAPHGARSCDGSVGDDDVEHDDRPIGGDGELRLLRLSEDEVERLARRVIALLRPTATPASHRT